MNWIDFKDRKPPEEPKRRLLLLSGDGKDVITVWSDSGTAQGGTCCYPCWHEIEAPSKFDPFEVWWNDVKCCEAPSSLFVIKLWCENSWDAAIKYAKENK